MKIDPANDPTIEVLDEVWESRHEDGNGDEQQSVLEAAQVFDLVLNRLIEMARKAFIPQALDAAHIHYNAAMTPGKKSSTRPTPERPLHFLALSRACYTYTIVLRNAENYMDLVDARGEAANQAAWDTYQEEK